MRKPQLTLLVFLLFPFKSYCQESINLQNGWNAFNKNNRTEAKELFVNEVKNGKKKADANLSLALVSFTNGNSVEAFQYIKNFYSLSDNPIPYLYSLWTTEMVMGSFFSKKNKEQLEFLNILLGDSRLNGTMKAMVYETIGMHHQQSMKTDEELLQFTKIGAIENWQILGPFENTSASGYNKDFGVLEKPEPNSSFKNKNHYEIKWFSPPIERSDKWIDFTYNLAAGNSIMYAQTFLESSIDQDVIIRSGCSGSMKIWVNDKLVTNEIIERNCDLDVFNNNIKLQKGVNRILVQIGESEAGNANFLIRITDENGDIIPNLKSTTSFKHYSKAIEYSVKTIPFFSEEYFQKQIKNEPNNFINYVLLANTYLRNDKIFEAKQILKLAREIAPESSLISKILINLHSRDDNQTELNKEKEFIKKSDPISFMALQLNYEAAITNENFNDAEESLMQIFKLYGTSEYAEFSNLTLLGHQNKIEEIVKLSDTLIKKYPDAYRAMELSFIIEKEVNKNPEKANQILKDYLKQNYSDRVLKELANIHFQKGEKSEGLQMYKNRINAYPYKTGFYVDLADVYLTMTDYKNAAIYLKKALEFAPYTGQYWEKLANVQNLMGNKTEAVQTYKIALAYENNLFTSHKAIRQIEDKPDLFESFTKNDPEVIFKKSGEAKDFPEDNCIILLNDMQRIVYPEGATEEKNELIVKILKQDGIDLWKEYDVSFNENTQKYYIEQAEVLKKDGGILKAEMNENKVVFTGLQVGDAIHLVYKIENYSKGMLSGQFNDQFSFGGYFPVKQSTYSLLIPHNYSLNHTIINSNLKPEIKEIDNFKLYKWEITNKKAAIYETLMPPIAETETTLEVTSLPNWTFVANWYKDLASTKSNSDFEVQVVVKKLFENKPKNLSNLAKSKIIYQYILENINYLSVAFMQSGHVPQKASRTLSIKLGDCKDLSTLFVAMCSEVGIKANLVLVSTRDNGDNYMLLPSINFNHCIATLDIDNKTYFIELTNPKNSFGTLSSNLINATALKIPNIYENFESNLIKINPVNRIQNTIIRNTDVTFAENDLKSIVKTIKTGSQASETRNLYEQSGDEERLKNFTSIISQDFTNSTKVNSLLFENLVSLNDSVKYKYDYLVKDELSSVAGMKIFQLPWSENLKDTDFINIEKRNYSFLLWSLFNSDKMIETITLSLPASKKLLELPTNVFLTNNFAEFKMTYVSKQNIIQIKRELTIKKDIITPDQYPVFREFIYKIGEADSRKYAFK